MQAANNAHRGIAFKYTRRKKLNANALAAKQKVPKPSEAPKPKGVWGTRVAAAAAASAASRKNTNNKNKSTKRIANRFLGKPPRHPRGPRGAYPKQQEIIFYGRNVPIPENKPMPVSKPKPENKPKEQMFLEYLKERSNSKRKGSQSSQKKVDQTTLEKMTFGMENVKTYGDLKGMTKEQGIKWLGSQPEEFDLVDFFKHF